MQLPFIKTGKAGRRCMGGRVRSLPLDMWSVRGLSANQMSRSSRQLDISEPGIDERGLGCRDQVESWSPLLAQTLGPLYSGRITLT